MRVLKRRSDGLMLTENMDGTWSFIHQRVSMPTTFYSYDLNTLLSTGEFYFSIEESQPFNLLYGDIECRPMMLLGIPR